MPTVTARGPSAVTIGCLLWPRRDCRILPTASSSARPRRGWNGARLAATSSLKGPLAAIAHDKCMSDHCEQSKAERLEMLKWHIVRSDGQRVGIWTRAAAVLGADTLVLAGATVLLTLSSSRQLPRWIALVAMILVLLSVIGVAQVIGTVKDWARTVEPESPTPALFNLQGSISLAVTYSGFRELVTAQDVDSQVEAATSELWRLSHLHRRRVKALRVAGNCLLLAVAALMLAGAASAALA